MGDIIRLTDILKKGDLVRLKMDDKYLSPLVVVDGGIDEFTKLPICKLKSVTSSPPKEIIIEHFSKATNQ